MKKVKTRFAPSPTGYLHIGGVRTALFNYLYAKHCGGEFVLRIEDTDRERYTPEAIELIYRDLKWMGLAWDEIMESQFARRDRHMEVANELLVKGAAYKCFTTKEELAELREKATEEKRAFRFESKWRDVDPADYPIDQEYVVRLKTPLDGETIVNDDIRGTVSFPNKDIDDLILVRSDNTPVYQLSVVVDDHDMGITHVIRGEEHLNNAPKQVLIMKAMGWDEPTYGHIPLILAPAGQQGKLSKRHGATAVGDYINAGFLPEGLFNYLLRLGWGHGDDEIISREQAIEWFDLSGVVKAGARFDMQKAISVNGYYIREADTARVTELTIPFLEKKLDRILTDAEKELLSKAMPEVQERVKTLVEAADLASFYFISEMPELDEKTKKVLDKPIPVNDSEESKHPKEIFCDSFAKLEELDWTVDSLNDYFNALAEKHNVKLGKMLQPLRVAIAYSTITPPLYEAMVLLGKEECLKRMNNACD